MANPRVRRRRKINDVSLVRTLSRTLLARYVASRSRFAPSGFTPTRFLPNATDHRVLVFFLRFLLPRLGERWTPHAGYNYTSRCPIDPFKRLKNNKRMLCHVFIEKVVHFLSNSLVFFLVTLVELVNFFSTSN